METAVVWHDLRENALDLPEYHYGRFSKSSWVIDDCGYTVRYNYDKSYWEDQYGTEITENPPIAWCMPPVFPNKE